MIAIDLRTVLLFLLLLAAGAGWTAVILDRRRFRDPLWLRVGVPPTQLARYFDATPIGFLLLDRQLRPLYSNPYTQQLLQIKPETPLPTDADWYDALQQDLDTARETAAHSHYRLFTLATGLVLSWWVCALPQLNLLLLLDMTTQHRLQQNAQTFLSNLSHELRTPLTAVLAHLAVVQNEQIDETVRDNSLQIAQQEMERLSRLVQDMLQLGRLEVSGGVEQRPLNLLLVVEAAIARLMPEAEAREIALTLDADTPLPSVLGDGDKLQQVLLNILDNSIKYCHPGDRIEVRLQREEDRVRVTIFDTGPGIPPEHLPRVGERFYRANWRANRQTPGSGLGLSIATEILRHHHTTLEISSESEGEETYTAVSFLLPAVQS